MNCPHGTKPHRCPACHFEQLKAMPPRLNTPPLSVTFTILLFIILFYACLGAGAYWQAQFGYALNYFLVALVIAVLALLRRSRDTAPR